MSGPRDGEAAAQLALLMKIVEQEVNRLAARMPTHSVEREELFSCAMIGLCEARARFKPDRGVPLGAYARLRIRGSLLDGMRNSLGLVRRRYFETFQRQQINAQSPQSLQQHITLLKQEIVSTYLQGAASQCPEHLMAEKERSALLYRAIGRLDQEKQMLISRLFGLEGVQDNGEVLAQSLGCHRSSISRRKNKILGELRMLLRDEFASDDAPPKEIKRPERSRYGQRHRSNADFACTSARSKKRWKDRQQACAQGKIPRSL